MRQERKLHIGWAQNDITPSRPVLVFGQLYTRVSGYVHDPITVTALALDNGAEQLVLVSLDIAGPSPALIRGVRAKIASIPGLDPDKVSFNAIHSHNSVEFSGGSDLFELLFGRNLVPPEIQPIIEKPADILEGEEGFAFLTDRIAEAVLDAWESRRPGKISYAADYAAVACNRRPVFDLGGGQTEARMYGACSEDNFVRLEGGSDHTADMLYTWDTENQLTGVVVDIPCPSQVCELHGFISADYWSPARDEIREALGGIFILPLCGVAGDQNPIDLIRISKTNEKELKLWNAQASEVLRNFDMTAECQAIGARIAAAVSRGYRKARNRIDGNVRFAHQVIQMSLPIRQVGEADFLEASAYLAAEIKRFSGGRRMTNEDVARVFEPCGVIVRWEDQNRNPFHHFEIHIVRLGGIAIATSPFEPFVDYGLRIRARSKAEQVFLVQLANGNFGYLPTETAVKGGSYSGKPASTPCGPEGGRQLTERTIAEINRLWQTDEGLPRP